MFCYTQHVTFIKYEYYQIEIERKCFNIQHVTFIKYKECTHTAVLHINCINIVFKSRRPHAIGWHYSFIIILRLLI
jgi:hypothetical protein